MGKDLKGKELGKGILQRKDGSYQARFENRFGKRQSIYASDLRSLKKKFNQAIYDDKAMRNVKDNILTVNKWFETWLNTYKSNEVRESSLLIYSNIYRLQIAPEIGEMKIKDVSTLIVKQLLNNLKKKDFSYEIRNKTRILLQDMFDKALLDEYVAKNPVRAIKLARDDEKDVYCLSKKDQTLFFNCALGTYCYNMFVIQLLTGLRPGELFALTEDDVDIDKMELKVTKTLSYQKFLGDSKKTFHLGEPKTKASFRTIPINDNFLGYFNDQVRISRIMQNNFPNGTWKEFGKLLFITRGGAPYNVQNYNSSIAKIVTEINYQYEPIEQIERFSGHTFRHTFATRCLESNVPPKVLQSYLGHATLQMTMDLYVHVFEEFSKEEMKKVQIDSWCKDGVKFD